MTNHRGIGLAAVGLGLAPTLAQAHLVSTGFGAFYDGMSHLLITPEDLLVVVGLGLLAGLRGAAAARAVLVVLPLAWLGGALLGRLWPGGGELPLALVLSFGLVGGLVAADRELRRAVVIGVAGLAGVLHGYVNGATLAAGGRAWLAVLGVTTAVFVLVSLLPAVVVKLRVPWLRVAVRVAGSWMVAVSLLMVGWLTKEAQ